MLRVCFLLAGALCLAACQLPEVDRLNLQPFEAGIAPPETTDGGATIDAADPVDSDAPAEGLPASTWHEHWFEHDRFVKIVGQDQNAVVYFDDDVNRTGARWVFPFISRLWSYVKTTYGVPGGEQLHAVFHEGRYTGGHTSTIFDASHDFRNVVDYGGDIGLWQTTAFIERPVLEAGVLLENTSLGVQDSPSNNLSGFEFRWIFAYDALIALREHTAAARLLDAASKTTRDFPRAGTYWFRDWYYPLWMRGGATLFSRYFQLLFDHYPKLPTEMGGGVRYGRDMNWGEYVHFMSGAADKDLRPLATTAFGWTADNEAQFAKAQATFPAIHY